MAQAAIFDQMAHSLGVSSFSLRSVSSISMPFSTLIRNTGGSKGRNLQYRDFLLLGIAMREGVEVVRDHTTPCEGVDVHRPKPIVVFVFPSSSAEV
jgi:hypothetical protein